MTLRNGNRHAHYHSKHLHITCHCSIRRSEALYFWWLLGTVLLCGPQHEIVVQKLHGDDRILGDANLKSAELYSTSKWERFNNKHTHCGFITKTNGIHLSGLVSTFPQKRNMYTYIYIYKLKYIHNHNIIIFPAMQNKFDFSLTGCLSHRNPNRIYIYI